MTTQWTTLGSREPDEAAFPEPPGGGFLFAIAGGLSAAGAIFLVFLPPLVLIWLATASILTGAGVRRAAHLVTATVTAVVPAIATFVLVQCLTGAWAWLLAGIVVFAAVAVVGVPLGFLIGRVVRGRLAGGYRVIRIVVAVTAVLAGIAWGIVLLNAVAPGDCPPAL